MGWKVKRRDCAQLVQARLGFYLIFTAGDSLSLSKSLFLSPTSAAQGSVFSAGR